MLHVLPSNAWRFVHVSTIYALVLRSRTKVRVEPELQSADVESDDKIRLFSAAIKQVPHCNPTEHLFLGSLQLLIHRPHQAFRTPRTLRWLIDTFDRRQMPVERQKDLM